nr:MAG TPA: protein of unknown function (DUF4549) [Caudoviricetes sp.]
MHKWVRFTPRSEQLIQYFLMLRWALLNKSNFC